jgi:hypothetical protein
MSNEKDIEVLQSLLQYYRSKCSQLEYEFLLLKATIEFKLKEPKDEQTK